MNIKIRTHVVIPGELVEEIDRLLGKRKRSRFVAEAIRKEIQRLNFINAVKETAGAWKDEDHAEFKKGVKNWVRRLRDEDKKRLEDIS
ncbi:MAG TPA: hypothetical protein VIH07_02765 [Candidatus Humimicrobiaceae bacterium]